NHRVHRTGRAARDSAQMSRQVVHVSLAVGRHGRLPVVPARRISHDTRRREIDAPHRHAKDREARQDKYDAQRTESECQPPHATALECQKAGADPAVWLDTDALFYGNFKNYSVESLHRVSGHCVGLLDYVNSYVWLNGPRNPAPMATVPREKFAAMFEGEKAHF